MTYGLLVPCYNAESYLKSFLDNISKLNKAFDEVIFYDDCSTDGTADILASKGFEVIRGTVNKGAGYARNKLAELSSSNWFHFHDIDDKLHPDYLIKTSAKAETDWFDVILCNVDWHYPNNENAFLKWQYSDNEIVKNSLSYTISHPIGGINGLYKREKFLETGGFETQIRIWEDADLHVKLARNKARFCIIEEVLSYAIRYPASASSDQTLGWLTRADLLANYAKAFIDTATQQTIGQQAQAAASELILAQKYGAARKALILSEECSVKVPVSNSIMWTILKLIVPARIRIKLRLFQLQNAFNKR